MSETTCSGEVDGRFNIEECGNYSGKYDLVDIDLLLLSCVFVLCASMVTVPSVFRKDTDFAFAQAGGLQL